MLLVMLQIQKSLWIDVNCHNDKIKFESEAIKMYQKLKIDFEIPDELDREIDEYIHHLNYESGTSIDCYQEEIRVILNWCQIESILTPQQIEILRNYYQRNKMIRSPKVGL